MQLTPQQLEPLLDISIQNHANPILLGAPGIGKTAILNELAQKYNTKVFVVEANLLSDKSDIFGIYKKTEADGSFSQGFFPHYAIKEAILYANENPDKIVILYFDEINRSGDDSITTALMGITTSRKVGDQELPSNISVVLAGNDSGNIQAIDSAGSSRMVHYHIKPDADNLLAKVTDLHPFIQRLLKKYPNDIFSYAETDDDQDNGITNEITEDFTTFTTPRTLVKMSDFFKLAEKNDVLQNLLDNHKNIASGLFAPEEDLLTSVIQSHLGDNVASKHLLEIVTNTTSTSNGAPTFAHMPESVLDIFQNSTDPQTELHDAFVNDPELQTMATESLIVNGLSPENVVQLPQDAQVMIWDEVANSSGNLLQIVINTAIQAEYINPLTYKILTNSPIYGLKNTLEPLVSAGTIKTSN